MPLTVVPPDANGPNTLMKLVELQQIISQEDRASYLEATTPSGYGNPPQPQHTSSLVG